MPFLKECIKRFRLDEENLSFEQFIVAKVGKEIVGFGRIKPYQKVYELGCLGVLENHRRKGIGKALVKHLIKMFPQPEVYVTTDITEYFEKLGFKKVKKGPPELEEKIVRVCEKKLRQNVVIMVFKKQPPT